MSHLRNLFHRPLGSPKPSGQFPAPAAPAAPAVLRFAPDPIPPVAVATADFEVEQAHIRAESRLIFYADPHHPATDRFRLLRMRLRGLWTAGKLRKLLITSPLAHDGKSTTSANLATALAERGKRSVLLVDADFHHSTLAESLRLNRWVGLSECLQDHSLSPFQAIRRIEPLGWHLMPAGDAPRNPTELLQTPAFGELMHKLAPAFDWILIDSPPILPITDALSMLQHVDAGLLIVRAGRTSREAVERAVSMLGQNRIAGVVLNGVDTTDPLYYGYYGGTRVTQE